MYKVTIEKQTLKNNPKKIQNIVNKTYSNWTGLGKKLKAGGQERLNLPGKRTYVTPYFIQEMRIEDVTFWDLIKDTFCPVINDPKIVEIFINIEDTETYK